MGGEKLLCQMGKDFMPYMCGSFPLGELMTTFPSSSEKKEFNILSDPSLCEGLSSSSSSSSSPQLRKVSDYKKENRMGEKKEERDWFNGVSNEFAGLHLCPYVCVCIHLCLYMHITCEFLHKHPFSIFSPHLPSPPLISFSAKKFAVKMEHICQITAPPLVAEFGEEKNFFLDVLYGVCRQLWFDLIEEEDEGSS